MPGKKFGRTVSSSTSKTSVWICEVLIWICARVNQLLTLGMVPYSSLNNGNPQKRVYKFFFKPLLLGWWVYPRNTGEQMGNSTPFERLHGSTKKTTQIDPLLTHPPTIGHLIKSLALYLKDQRHDLNGFGHHGSNPYSPHLKIKRSLSMPVGHFFCNP